MRVRKPVFASDKTGKFAFRANQEGVLWYARADQQPSASWPELRGLNQMLGDKSLYNSKPQFQAKEKRTLVISPVSNNEAVSHVEPGRCPE
jgi:hypothetical protein